MIFYLLFQARVDQSPTWMWGVLSPQIYCTCLKVEPVGEPLKGLWFPLAHLLVCHTYLILFYVAVERKEMEKELFFTSWDNCRNDRESILCDKLSAIQQNNENSFNEADLIHEKYGIERSTGIHSWYITLI